MDITSLATNWLVCPKPDSKAHLRLFCFPCAGGMTSAYARWSTLLPIDVEVCTIHLPGREKRMAEKPFVQVTKLVPALTEALRDFLDIPFVFLGHSMGAVLAFEIARCLRQHHLPEPLHLFCCSCPAPQIPIATPHIHQLPDTAFITELNRRYMAIPKSIQADHNILKLFLPGLRADFTMLETYVYTPDDPLDCLISAYAGKQDRAIRSSDLAAWRDQTRRSFELKIFEGDHFFLHQQPQPFLKTLISAIASLMA